MSRRFLPATIRGLIPLLLVLVLPLAAVAESLGIVKVESMPLFPKARAGEPLRQIVRLSLKNPGAATEAKVKIALPGTPAYEESLGSLPSGISTKDIRVPEISRPTEFTVELFGQNAGQPADVKKVLLQPQKKWNIYCVSYSHHDLGFGNYPHRVRTDIRHANIERPLQFCRDTDSWDEDSRFRFVVETSEPITSFLGSHSEADATELARRIREGRIQIGAIHTTVSTEQMSQELMARLFYLTNRHMRDLLGVPPAKTAQIDDVIGLTWPLATFCHAAGIPYFFHGHNAVSYCFKAGDMDPKLVWQSPEGDFVEKIRRMTRDDPPVFFWQGPGGDPENKVLMQTSPYGMTLDSLCNADEAAILKLVEEATLRRWPGDVTLSQDGTDFQLVSMDNASKIHNWNARWAYPHLICATMDMFFDAVAAQTDPAKIKTFAKDGNNQWVDQDAAAARVLADARRQGEAIPTAEKFATIASVLAGGEYPWTDIYQAYHRLLLYHEHTDGIDNPCDPGRETAQRYETEQEEMREMVRDAQFFGDRARQGALDRLAGLIAARARRNVIVFNPLNHVRTDVVRVAVADLGENAGLIDAATHKAVPVQRDGSDLCFIAADVPSLGYKSFRVVASPPPLPNSMHADAGSGLLENRFYRVRFDAATGAITSIFDKQLQVELVDRAAPHKFNEYLYERFETPRFADGSKWYRVKSAVLQGSAGPVAARMTVKSAAVGAEKIVQSVTVYNDIKRIDFTLDLVKSPSGRDCRTPNNSVQNKESVYVSLPLAIPDFRFHHELPGAVVEPIKDQFKGTCTAYHAVRHFSDVSNAKYGVTVSAPESSLFEYGRPRSCPVASPDMPQYGFEMDMTYPGNSRMYLYLMDNMFDTNIPVDQRGPARFTWSLRSHEGDWKQGRADQFGWETLNPLMAKVAVGERAGPLPKSGGSFLAVNQPNVVCTTIKPAEANGRGIVLRFVETQGKPTTASFQAAFFGTPEKAIETSLLEEDREPLTIGPDGKVTFTIPAFGVKTIRLTSQPPTFPFPANLAARPLSDMEVALQWTAPDVPAERIGYYRVYRGTKPDFRPGLLNLVDRVAGTSAVDRPVLHFGGWINNRLEPGTTYYYRVALVDRWNNESPPSPAVRAVTLKSSEKNALPNRVERLSAILVSPLHQHNYVNLLFRANCESDVVRYEIHRSAKPGFTPNEATRIGQVNADAIVKGSTAYGHTPVDHQVRDYDHIMYQDDAVEPLSEYFYRVRAVDAAGQKGPFSDEASVTTKGRKP